MSGAAEGIAGLSLSAVSVAALFTTCIECFDIVVAGKNFSEDYEQLCALFSLQRARFGLWGESVGLIPNPNDGRRLRYDQNLDRQDIRPGVERILNNIKSLLDEAGRVDERYGVKDDPPQSCEVSTSRGLDIFKGSFERFKSRIRKHQKDTSAWKVTRWAVHDADKFESIIDRLKSFVDGLEAITKSLGLLEEQHARLRQEIETISDTESLRLLRDASSRDGASDHDVPDTASRRLITAAESFIEGRTIDSSSRLATTAESFVTARSGPSAMKESIDTDELEIPGAWPESMKIEPHPQDRHRRPPISRPLRVVVKPTPSCQGCLEEHYKCVVIDPSESCPRCVQTQRQCSFLPGQLVAYQDCTSTTPMPDSTSVSLGDSSTSTLQDLPQHQRLINELIGRAKPRKPLSFAVGDADYGKLLSGIKRDDEIIWLGNSGKILLQADGGSSAAKRMFLELRDIRSGKVPFVRAVPLDDSLDKVLASIEGPPETPYEGGIFWITVKLPENDPFGPPLMRFHTKVYHPNISPQGHICADYKEKWNAVLSPGVSEEPGKDPSAHWFRGKSTEPKWTLGALLIALCGLLASPDVDDPLVPEIAAKYLEDYEGYCENARLYTKKFATDRRRPDLNILHFLEDSKPSESAHAFPEPNNDIKSLQGSFRVVDDAEALFIKYATLWKAKFPSTADSDWIDIPLSPASSALGQIPEPDNDIKSLQDSLRAVDDTKAFFAKYTTPWKADFASTADSDSIDTTRDELSSTVGQSLDRALLSIFGWPKGRDHVKSSYLESNYLAATLETLASKEDLENFLWQATDQKAILARFSNAEIVHALLLKADSFLKTQSAREMNLGVTPLEPLTTYQNLKKASIEYLRTMFSEANLLVVYGKSSACYEISISCPGRTKYEHIWQIRRTWDEFVQLNDSISSHTLAAALWVQKQGWRRRYRKRNIDHSGEPDANVMGPLLELRLKRSLLYSKEILGLSEVISFLHPQGDLQFEYSSFTVTIPENSMYMINFRSFIPDVLFDGGSRATSYTLHGHGLTIWQRCQDLRLSLEEVLCPRFHWVVTWPAGLVRKFFRAEDIVNIRMQETILGMDRDYPERSRVLSIEYSRSHTLPKRLDLYFHSKSDHDLWYETLLLLRRMSSISLR